MVKGVKLVRSWHGSPVAEAEAEDGCGKEGSVNGPNITIKPSDGFVGCVPGQGVPVLKCSLYPRALVANSEGQ